MEAQKVVKAIPDLLPTPQKPTSTHATQQLFQAPPQPIAVQTPTPSAKVEVPAKPAEIKKPEDVKMMEETVKVVDVTTLSPGGFKSQLAAQAKFLFSNELSALKKLCVLIKGKSLETPEETKEIQVGVKRPREATTVPEVDEGEIVSDTIDSKR